MQMQPAKGNKSAAPLLFSLLVLISGVGCEERNHLASEIAAVRSETTGLQPQYNQAQSELLRLNKAYQALKAHPAIRKAGTTGIENDIPLLTKQKEQLEAEIEALRKDLEAYRAANP